HKEAYEFVSNVRAEYFFSEQEAAELTFYCLEIFSVMCVAAPLTNWSFVKNRGHSLDEPIVKRSGLDNYPFFFRFSGLISGGPINLSFPPVGITLDWKRRYGIPFHRVRIPWFCIRQALPESQNIRAILGSSKCVEEYLWVLYVLEPLLLRIVVRPCNPHNLPFDQHFLPVDFHARANSLPRRLGPSALNYIIIVHFRQCAKAPEQCGGKGKDSNLRYGFNRIATLANHCLRSLSYLSNRRYR